MEGVEKVDEVLVTNVVPPNWVVEDLVGACTIHGSDGGGSGARGARCESVPMVEMEAVTIAGSERGENVLDDT